MMTHIFKMRNL